MVILGAASPLEKLKKVVFLVDRAETRNIKRRYLGSINDVGLVDRTFSIPLLILAGQDKK